MNEYIYKRHYIFIDPNDVNCNINIHPTLQYIKNIHIKDKNSRGLSVRLGRGKVNFKKNFYYLKKLKYKGFFSLQTARSKFNNHIEEIKNNFEFLKKNKYFE